MTLHVAGPHGRLPTSFTDDVAAFGALAPEIVSKIWHVLGPAIDAPGAPETRQAFELFAGAYHLDEVELAAAVRAARHLFEAAARYDLDERQVAADIQALLPEAPNARTVLLANFDAAKQSLRRAIVARAIADHGNVLVGTSWRVDVVDASDGGVRLGVPVALLTLRYRCGDAMKTVTFQALPDVMAELREACEQVLLPAPESPLR